ncbi:hypothetical protein GR200_30970 [Rhizobium leguminosarum]|uniref:hypothetical protein n=1 Tax=Rhizobium leguminosarum TaxID=384 RepID=UPI0013B694B9|nr:hypothetical protein [Rhizobium leguminosarum]NEI59454.1 hypothetical protein [Rhizobium leguminosarum]NEI88294.1 hypothetical protein [Rhizobium leguminosarum]
MRIAQRSAYAMRLAKTFYRGESPPISAVKPEDKPLSVEWWTTNFQPESAESDRHLGALLLYLELAKSSKIALPKFTFPARLDLDDLSMRPDKGVIKVFLETGLIAPRMMGSQLVFDVSESGRNYLASRIGQNKL